ncbi:MAG: T9SS type A sorting domain-containing protein [Bacteroidales bacterium]|nr:T9SS type A sorting domain-containing protein [Bacteroidales bacterium]
MDSANYTLAETQFKAIIANYPGTIYSRESAKKLIPLTKMSDQDFTGLAVYFDTTAALHSDSLTDQLIYRLKNICTVEKENYSEAIIWYENDIINPASLNDSVYSLIDLSDTYVLMQADSSLKSSTSNYCGALIQYKPKNHQEHVSRSDEWIKLLFKDKSAEESKDKYDLQSNGYTLAQNNPNPFANSTQVTYTLPESGNVSITVKNMLGRQVLKVNRIEQNAGKYSITMDLSKYPDGIYFISLVVDGKITCKIKAVKTK